MPFFTKNRRFRSGKLPACPSSRSLSAKFPGKRSLARFGIFFGPTASVFSASAAFAARKSAARKDRKIWDRKIDFLLAADSNRIRGMGDRPQDSSDVPAAAEGLRCPACGNELNAGARTCLTCGETVHPLIPPARRWYQLTLIELLVVVLIIVLLVALLLPAVQSSGRGEGLRYNCKNHLKQIGLALHNYHEKYGSFPPAYIADAQGRPMHSWRVLILPFFGQQELYDQYRFDEPWDGPHNSELAKQPLIAFNCGTENRNHKRAATTTTSYVAVVGPETAWPGERPMTLNEITDGTADTLLVVETTNSGIHWIEPRDLHISQMAKTINSPAEQGISSSHPGGAHALKCDGAARFLSDTLPAEQIRALLTRAGGETVGEY